MHGCLKTLLFAALLVFSTIVVAQEEDENYTSFNSIVSQLETAAEEPVPKTDDWEEVALHGGVGLIVSSYQVRNVHPGEGILQASGTMYGFQAHFGMNMFSKRVRVEGLFRNYNSDTINSDNVVDLKEFEMRGIFLPMLGEKTRLRAGAGFAARYMSLNKEKATTPFASVMFGFERMISPTVSVGPDWSYRSALVSDTFDKSSWDAAIKLNATF